MIQRLLPLLEQNPHTLFSRNELKSLVGEPAIASLVQSGLLQRSEDVSATSVFFQGRMLRVVREPDGSLVGIDEEDAEFDDLVLQDEDLIDYRVDFKRLGWRVASHLALEISWSPFTDRLFGIGELGHTVSVSIALARNELELVALLQTLPSLMPSGMTGHIAISPTINLSLAARRTLESARVAATTFSDNAMNVSPTIDAVARIWTGAKSVTGFDPTTGLRWSVGFHRVTAPGFDYKFTTQQGQVVELLLEAFQNGTPEVHQSVLLERIGSNAPDLRDTFKDHEAFGTFIVRASQPRGCFRLQFSETPE